MLHSRAQHGALCSTAVIVIAFSFGLAIACDSDSSAPEDAPTGHTVVMDGVPHSPGLNAPAENCSGCHGSDLRGGDNGEPSCFSCHGQKWP